MVAGGVPVVYVEYNRRSRIWARASQLWRILWSTVGGQTYEYAKTILDLATREVHERGKVLIIGGGIANFTDVKKTFKGIVRALHEYAERLRAGNFRIYVRRAGPNYQEGLQLMRQTGAAIGVPIAVHGPETHITAIVPMAIEYLSLKNTSGAAQEITLDKNDFISTVISKASAEKDGKEDGKKDAKKDAKPFALPQDQSVAREPFSLFSAASRACIYGMQPRAVQGMLDFDFLSQRKRPSVASSFIPLQRGDSSKKSFGARKNFV